MSQNEERSSPTTLPGSDPLLDAARALLAEKGTLTASQLQRTLRIGYGRATSILDALYAERPDARPETPPEASDDALDFVGPISAPMISMDEDPLLDAAVRLVIGRGEASVSFLRQALLLGYGRAIAIVDRMEELGVVSSAETDAPRQILMTLAAYEAMRSNGGEGEA